MRAIIVGAAVFGALLAAGGAGAQDFASYRPKQSMYILNYEVSAPVGDFHDNFVSNTSWRGIGFEGRSFVKEKISVGLGFDFNRYDQTYSLITQTTGNGGTISGPVYRYADQFALKGLLHYYILDQGFAQPYVGVGLGGVWTYSYGQTADLAITDNGFDFIASPEVGVSLTAAKGASQVGLNVAFRYNYTTADFSKVNDAQNIQVVVGIFGAY
jgi:hypothetical protein